MKLQNKVALITGAGTGIGAAIAKRFVEDGAKIVIMGRRKEKLEETAAGLPADSVKICQGDVANADDVKRAVAETLEFGGGKIDVLVNCAGVNFPGSVTIDLNDWNRFFAINVNGPFMLMRKQSPICKKPVAVPLLILLPLADWSASQKESGIVPPKLLSLC